MRPRPWHLLLVTAALLVPLQAGALNSSPSRLTVSASLDYCGVGATGIVCKIDTSWSGVEGADRYTSTVTLADGSVRDFGTIGAGSGGGSTSLFVPYAGNGVYAVTVTAWGADPEGKDEEIEEADAGADVSDGKEKPGDGAKGGGDGAGSEPGAEQPAEPDPEPATDPQDSGTVIDPGALLDEAPAPAEPGPPADSDKPDGEPIPSPTPSAGSAPAGAPKPQTPAPGTPDGG